MGGAATSKRVDVELSSKIGSSVLRLKNVGCRPQASEGATLMGLVLLVLLLSANSAHAESVYLNQIPDFTQTEVQGTEFGDGSQFCGPVAVSNSLMWLTKSEGSQVELIKQLASPGYMNTSLKIGTGTEGMLKGVERIAGETFGGHEKLEYQGWRKHQAKFSSGVSIPELQWIKAGVKSNSAVWVNVGWYKQESPTELRRVGGHWLTLVGHGEDHLIFHDPSPRAGDSFANEIVFFKVLQSGTLTGKKAGLPRPARGYISLGRGMHIKRSADYALVDGVIRLEI